MVLVNSNLVLSLNSSACNYDADAIYPADCEFPDQYLDCDGNCVNDADGDGVCDEQKLMDVTTLSNLNTMKLLLTTTILVITIHVLSTVVLFHSLVTMIQTPIQTTVAVISILVFHLVVLTQQLVTSTLKLHFLMVRVNTVLVQVV